MMGELKHIKISNLNFLVVTSLHIWNVKKFCKTLVDAHIRFLIIQTIFKMRKYGARIKEGSRVFFSKKLKQTIMHSLSMFFALLLDM
jgi:hypothetical protein